MEKLMKNALTPSISPLHAETQYGFTAGRSTIDALWHQKILSTRKYVMTIFIDVKGILSCAVQPFRRVFSVLCV
jgi:retron-type reverse transcriptase